jgi:hypothetical protein
MGVYADRYKLPVVVIHTAAPRLGYVSFHMSTFARRTQIRSRLR